MLPKTVSGRIKPRPERPHSLTPNVSAATAIIPKPKLHASCSNNGIRSLKVGNKKRKSHIPAAAVNKGSRKAMAVSELELNQAGLVGGLMGRFLNLVT